MGSGKVHAHLSSFTISVIGEDPISTVAVWIDSYLEDCSDWKLESSWL